MEKKNRIVVDETRAYRVFSALQKAWEKKEGVFDDVVLPESRFVNLPKDPRARANFLFFASITMRGGMVSDDPVRWLDQMALVHPDLFEPRRIIESWTEERICELFSDVTGEILLALGLEIGVGKMGPKYRDFARSWRHNARVIQEVWDGNVLNVFNCVEDFEEAFSRVDYREVGKSKGLKGIRRKIFSLFTIWLQTFGLIPVFATPLPIDFHALRLLQGTKIVKFSLAKPYEPGGRGAMHHWKGQIAFRVSETITDLVARWSQWFMVGNGFDHLAINPALWVLSRTLCADHFQNSCEDRVIPKAPPSRKFKLEDWPVGYRDPCQFCPVEKCCHYVAPSGPYYRWGVMVRVKRVPCLLPKQLVLPGLEDTLIFTGRKKSSSVTKAKVMIRANPPLSPSTEQKLLDILEKSLDS